MRALLLPFLLLFGKSNAKTRRADVAALYLFKERAMSRTGDGGRWWGAVSTWSGKGEECLDCELADPCGLTWEGNWEGIECRGQDHLPEDVERVVTNFHLPDRELEGNFYEFEELALLSNLTEIDIDGNKLTGPLPDWFACFPNMLELDLANNQFSGDLPKSWGHLSQLVELEVENNEDLEGCLPRGLPPMARWMGRWSTGFSEDPIVGISAGNTKLEGVCDTGPMPPCPQPLTEEEVEQIIARNMPLFPIKEEPEFPQWMLGGPGGTEPNGGVGTSEGTP